MRTKSSRAMSTAIALFAESSALAPGLHQAPLAARGSGSKGRTCRMARCPRGRCGRATRFRATTTKTHLLALRRRARRRPPHTHTHSHRPRALGLALVMPWGSCRLDVETRGSPGPCPTTSCVWRSLPYLTLPQADDCDVTSRLDPMRCRCSGTSPLHHPRPGMYNAVLRPDRFGTGHRLGIENAPAGGPSQITDHIPAEVSRTCLGSASEVPRKRLVPAQACGGRTTSRSSTRWRCRPTCRTESGCSAGGGTARSRTRCGPRAPT